MNAIATRNRFLVDKVTTATPARRLIMVFDRLLLDLARAEEALKGGDLPTARPHLVHAQEIVGELAATLQEGTWDGSEQLRAIYLHCLTELIAASSDGSLERVLAVRGHASELRDTWQQAEAALTSARGGGELGVG